MSCAALTWEITVVDPSLFQFRIVPSIVLLDGEECRSQNGRVVPDG